MNFLDLTSPMNHYTPASRKWLLLIPLLGILAYSQAMAQVALNLQMNKKNYLIGEPVTATVSITNHSGRQLVLSGDQVSSWLNFQLSIGGRNVPPARRINYKPAVIPAGQTIARSVNISTTYALGRIGNYTASSSVKMPGTNISGFTSNRVHFTVAGGRTVWAQRAGLPQAPNEIREYKLITFNNNLGLDLYAEVKSQNTGRRIATIPLGKVLNFRNPTATLDRQNNMHCLYQVKPDLFAHAVVTPKGQIISSSYHKPGALGKPRLTTFTSGEVKVAGSVPYDPKAEAAERRKIRNISERPNIVYK